MKEKLARKIYKGYAFANDDQEKHGINISIYNEIKDKVVKYYGNQEIDKKDLDTKCVCTFNTGHHHTQYYIESNPENLSTDEIALCCDGGNLCFGYRALSGGSSIEVFED